MTIPLLSLVKPNVSGNCRGYKPRQIVGVEPDYQQNHDMKAVLLTRFSQRLARKRNFLAVQGESGKILMSYGEKYAF